MIYSDNSMNIKKFSHSYQPYWRGTGTGQFRRPRVGDEDVRRRQGTRQSQRTSADEGKGGEVAPIQAEADFGRHTPDELSCSSVIDSHEFFFREYTHIRC